MGSCRRSGEGLLLMDPVLICGEMLYEQYGICYLAGGCQVIILSVFEASAYIQHCG